MPTPCFQIPEFTSEDREDLEYASTLCGECPVRDACLQLGIGEKYNVYGGLLPKDPVRRAHRKTINLTETCPQGHSRELYAQWIEGGYPGHQALKVCTRCLDLEKYIADYDPDHPTPIPETPIVADRIRHGTDAGYRAHHRLGEDACKRCLRAHAEANARRELEREAEAS